MSKDLLYYHLYYKSKPMCNYSDLTDKEFDKILEELVSKMSAKELLDHGDIYLACKEMLNDEVITVWEERKNDQKES